MSSARPITASSPAFQASHEVSVPRPLLAAWMLCWREIVRFFRQRHRVIGAVGQPILFWLLFGVGMHRTFQLPTTADGGPTFLEYFFPGTLVLILLFTAIFATISIIEDRREGFLQSVLVAPVPRWSMLLGKVLGGTLIAVAQGLIFLVLALTLDIRTDLVSVLGLVALLLVSAFALTSLGFVIAWRMESTQGFHAIMNLVLMPMWLLSGAFFPAPESAVGAPISQWLLHWAVRLNPVTYCVAGVRNLLFGPTEGIWSPTLTTCWIVTLAFAAIMFGAAWTIAGKRTTGDLL
jgi:ABC-2 type transport system permease protein